MPIAPANVGDESAIRALLLASELPESDVSPDSGIRFLVLREEQGIVGVIGLEIGGPVALLRSLAVDPDRRRGGVGSKLARAAERTAAQCGVLDLWLLTTTAVPAQPRPTTSGPRRNSRDCVPPPRH